MNKLNNLKEHNVKLNDLLIRLRKAEEEVIEKYNKPINWNREQIELEKYDNLVKNLQLKIAEVEKLIIINKDKIEQEIDNAIIESSNLIELIYCIVNEEITKDDIYKLIKKASEQKQKIVYHDIDEYMKELPKNTFTNNHLYIKKGEAIQHNKIFYIRNVTTIIENIMYNRNVLIEYLDNTSDPDAKADAEAFRKEEIKFLKALKVYIAVLQKIYDMKL